MRRVTLRIPAYLPEPVYRFLASTKRALLKPRAGAPAQPSGPNLLGDRDVEWSWIGSQMPEGPGEALDFGAGGSFTPIMAVQAGFQTTVIDLIQHDYPYQHPNLSFIIGDLLETSFPESHYDLIINCSTVEHVGLSGRYGVTRQRDDGDLEAMALLRTLIKPTGRMLLTIPVGLDEVFAPLCRVYGEKRLPELLKHYSIDKERYWQKNNSNQWEACNKDLALNTRTNAGSWNALESFYNLGCFVLRPD